MANVFDRFMDLNIPMLENYKGDAKSPVAREEFLEKYRKLMKNQSPVQFIAEMVGPDASLRQNLHGVTLILPAKEVYEDSVLTMNSAKSAIGRHFTVEVTDVTDDAIYVSRVRAVFGDGSVRERANRRIRQVCGEVSRTLAPYADELRAQAEKDAKVYAEEQKKNGRELREPQISAYASRRYIELFEEKKTKLGVTRCIIPAVVESVQGNRVILNLFNLDIPGICMQANWSRRPASVSLAEQATVGDTVIVEVLYHVDEKRERDEKLKNGWMCSRRNMTDEQDGADFHKKIAKYPLKTSVQVVCDRVLPNGAGLSGGARFVGHVVNDPDVRVFSRFGYGRIAIEKGKTYVCEITGVNEKRMQLEGRTVGYVTDKGGAYIPQPRKPRKERVAEMTEEETAYSSEPTFADAVGRPEFDGFE